MHDILQRCVPDREVWAFGSRAKWTAKEYSDLDIAIIGEEPLSMSVMAELMDAFQESELPFKVDVVDWATVQASFRRAIESSRKLIKFKPAGSPGRSNFPVKLLGSLARNLDSKRVPLSARERAARRGSYPYYGAASVMDFIDDYLFEGPHLLIAEDGSVEGPLGAPLLQLVDGKFWVNNHAHVLTCESRDDLRYLFYALSTIPVRPYLTGSVQAKLSQGNMNRIPVPYPDPSTRKGIAGILGALDDKIELNRKMSETLEAMARALFKSWFVDFDPVCAKAEGRDPGLPPEIAALFPDSFEDSELGKIPKGWQLRGLDEIARFLNGLALQKYPALTGRALPVIKIAQLRIGSTAGADEASADLERDYIVSDGDVLFSWSGSLECVLWTGGKGALNQHLFKVTSTSFPKWFFYLWIHRHLNDFRHVAAGKATTMGHIQRHHLSDAKAVIPTSEVLKGADSILSPLVERIITARLESRTLARLRDALLPKLISGEIRVTDAERIVEQTA